MPEQSTPTTTDKVSFFHHQTVKAADFTAKAKQIVRGWIAGKGIKRYAGLTVQFIVRAIKLMVRALKALFIFAFMWIIRPVFGAMYYVLEFGGKKATKVSVNHKANQAKRATVAV